MENQLEQAGGPEKLGPLRAMLGEMRCLGGDWYESQIHSPVVDEC